MITIFLNDQLLLVKPNITVQELIDSRCIEKRGIGVAVNDIFVKRSDWEKRALKDGDRVVIISATYGG